MLSRVTLILLMLLLLAKNASAQLAACTPVPCPDLTTNTCIVNYWATDVANDVNTAVGYCNTNTVQNGTCDCSLRAAIQAINAYQAANYESNPAVVTTTFTVDLASNNISQVTLTIPGPNNDDAKTGDLDILGSMRILGASTTTTINSNWPAKNNDRIFDIVPAFAVNGFVVEFDNLVIEGGNTSDSTLKNGGGILSQNWCDADNLCRPYTAAVTLNNTTVQQNDADYGGGICSFGGPLAIEKNSNITTNTASFAGGGVAIMQQAPNGAPTTVSLTLDNSSIQSNNAGYGSTSGAGGGGLYMDASSASPGTITSISSAINYNTVGGEAGTYQTQGGGVSLLYITGSFSGGTFYNNALEGNSNGGGGLFANYSTLTFSNVQFSGNSITSGGSSVYGGAGLFLENGLGSNYIGDSTIANNQDTSTYPGASYSGGGVVFLAAGVGDSLWINNSTISGNTTTASGAGINVAGGQTGSLVVSLNNVTLSNNIAGTDGIGGGMYLQAGDADIAQSTFNANQAFNGAGYYSYSGNSYIYNSTFVSNTASTSGYGGGLFTSVGSGVTYLSNDTFAWNSAGAGQGGGIANIGSAGQLLLRSTILDSNTGGDCGFTSASPTSYGYNLVSAPGTCSFIGSDLLNQSANFKGVSLATNGATQPDQSQSLLPPEGSPVIGAIPASACLAWTYGGSGALTNDQRDYSRPSSTNSCTIGSLEVAGSAPPPPPVSLNVTKTSSGGCGTTPLQAGQGMSYTITVRNTGAGDSGQVLLSDALPPLLMNYSGSTPYWQCSSVSGGTCPTPYNSGYGDPNVAIDLPTTNSEVVFTVYAMVPPGGSGTISNIAIATIAATNTEFFSNGNVACQDTITPEPTPPPPASITVSKNSSGNCGVRPLQAGTNMTYTITVQNTGGSDSGQVFVSDPLSTVSPYFVTSNTSWTCGSPAMGTAGNCIGATSGNGDIYSIPIDLPANTGVSFTVTAMLPANATGSLSNIATAMDGSGTAHFSNNDMACTDTIAPEAPPPPQPTPSPQPAPQPVTIAPQPTTTAPVVSAPAQQQQQQEQQPISQSFGGSGPIGSPTVSCSNGQAGLPSVLLPLLVFAWRRRRYARLVNCRSNSWNAAGRSK